jgi:hypothetical protein
MHHLWKILCRLPNIKFDETWGEQLLEIPLKKLALEPVDPTVIPTRISIKYTVEDHFEWWNSRLYPDQKIDQPTGPLKKLNREIKRGFWRWHPALRKNFVYNKTKRKERVEKLLECWGPTKKDDAVTPILKAKPKELRIAWTDPYEVQDTKMNAKSWKIFWKLDMPLHITTPWWRLLVNKTPTRMRLAKIFPNEYTPKCAICNLEEETDIHFWVQCTPKWRFWCRVAAELGQLDQLICPEAIWNIMRFEKKDENAFLLVIGRVMLAIWRQHWRVVIDRKPWNEQIAWSTFLNQPVPTITEQKAKPEWYSYTAEPTIDHFVSERLEMKAKSREMEKYKRGFIDEVQWYDANDDTKVVYTRQRLAE